jgi:hypothetical protein
MGVLSVQIALNSATATPLIVHGTGTGTGGDTTFKNTEGSIDDPIPALVTNLAASGGAVVWVGGQGVTTSTGTPIQPLASLPFSFVGSDSRALWAISGSDTPSVSVCLLRQ